MADVTARLSSALADRYKIEREIGAGGMATVYLAHDIKHDRKVAVKVLRREIAAALGAERFLREIKITAKLSHPHILPLLDSGEADGFLYYVMPYLQGKSLRDRLDSEGQLPIDDALRIAREVADALGSAHSHQVIHRDIKPENILFEEGHAVVADFGIARAVDAAGAEKLTETGLALGTPAYMSPEQASGEERLGARSDVYSLACVVYEMLGGEPPHTGPTPQAILARKLVGGARSLSPVRSSVTREFDEALQRALAPAASDRYATPGQFVEALASGAQSTDPRPPRAAARARGVAVAAGAGLLTVVMVGIFLLRPRASALDELEPGRILVMPFVMMGAQVSTTTEDVFTAVLHGLDGAADLHAVDGWSLLDARERVAVEAMPQDRIRDLAAARRSAYALTGRLAPRSGDSVEVFVSLLDVRGDSTIARASASGIRTHAWRAGLDAANQILPTVVGEALPAGVGLSQRNPAAVASFLLGEAAFRRARANEALSHYQAALATDSAFGLAAIRGAQAAAWAHEEAKAAALLDVAMASALSERDLALARGMHAYLQGDAESAVDHLQQALARDGDNMFAWTQLGEVYTHLVVRRGRPDTLAEAAFRRAQALDSGAVNVLYHLLEARYRRGEWRAAAPLKHRFLAEVPDERLAREIQIVAACIEGGPDTVDWDLWMVDPLSVQVSGHMLGVGGAQLRCAEAAFWALLMRDTLPDPGGGKKWSGVKGVFSLLLAGDRREELTRFLDSLVADGYTAADRLYSVAALLGVVSAAKADSVAITRSARYPVPTAGQAWYAGTWAAYRGDTATVNASVRAADRAASVFEVRADTLARTGSADAAFVADEARHARLLADALLAHAAISRGDSTEAIQRFRMLQPNAARASNRSLAWHLLEPLPLEQLRLAELLLAAGQLGEAFETASAFDAPAPLAFIAFIPASLELRIRAAEVMGRSDLVRPLRERLHTLRPRDRGRTSDPSLQ